MTVLDASGHLCLAEPAATYMLNETIHYVRGKHFRSHTPLRAEVIDPEKFYEDKNDVGLAMLFSFTEQPPDSSHAPIVRSPFSNGKMLVRLWFAS